MGQLWWWEQGLVSLRYQQDYRAYGLQHCIFGRLRASFVWRHKPHCKESFEVGVTSHITLILPLYAALSL